MARPEVKKIVAVDGMGYEITLETGKMIRVGAITSKGKPRKDDPNFDHLVEFSDGTTQKHVVSTETLIIPDYPDLQRY